MPAATRPRRDHAVISHRQPSAQRSPPASETGRQSLFLEINEAIHPELGEIVLDCDIMTIERADLHIVLNWAAPDTGAAQKLARLRERVATAAH
ncbi:hypothetical protein [Streptomyces xiamenensis]